MISNNFRDQQLVYRIHKEIGRSVRTKGNRNRHRNLWLFSQEVFSKSSLSGISQIAESKTWLRRLLWIVLFLSCILGFFYHATTYFALYAAYPTTVDVRVDNKGQMEFPGITLCNNNRLTRSLYCKEYYCTNDRVQDYDEYWRMNRSDRVRLGHSKQEIIIKCKLNGRIEMDEEQCYSSEHGNCFTFNALWNMADHKMLYAYESDMWNKPTELLLDLDVQAEEYLDDHKTPSILIYVHDPWFYPDFGSEAVKARAGHFYSVGMRKVDKVTSHFTRKTGCLCPLSFLDENQYSVHDSSPYTTEYEMDSEEEDCGTNISPNSTMELVNNTYNGGDFLVVALKGNKSVAHYMTTTKLLPLPYQTNCTTYSAMPWAKRNKGNLTPKMCTQECSRSLQLKACKCISSNLTLVYEDSSCEGKKAFCAEDVEKNTTDYCRTLCRVPCVRKMFEAAVDSSAWPRKRQMVNVPTWNSKNLTEIRKNLVRVKLYLRTMEVTMYEHQPKYELVEVFSHLGGYLSLWLGFSVLAFCELLEMVSMVFLRITDVKTSTMNTTEPKRMKRNKVRVRSSHRIY